MELFGRTNIAVPPVWLSLREPETSSPGWAEELCDAAVSAKTIIDITQRPALFGGLIAGKGSKVMAIGGADCGHAPDAIWAKNFIEAKLVSVLSCLRQDHLDFYFLDYTGPWEEWQINGALDALDGAKNDGLVHNIGLAPSGSELAALAMWQFHDAFDGLLVSPSAYGTLAPLANERRVGIVVREVTQEGWPTLRSFSKVEARA